MNSSRYKPASHDSRKYGSFILTALVAVIAGCASPRPKIDVVAQTLRTYQVGKTTFQDFKKDAGLIMTERPTPNFQPQHSYLNPQRQNVLEMMTKTQTVYGVPQGSPWKIYETGENVSLISGRFSRKLMFVVGDINKPISILTFDGKGGLAEISPVR